MIVYWSSASGNTHAFVESLGVEALRISKDAGSITVDKPFVLITPTFAAADGRGAIPKAVTHFLNIESNRRLLRGVIGAGNRNFGEMFCIGAREVAAKCKVPMLYKFELRGSHKDSEIVRQGLARFLA